MWVRHIHELSPATKEFLHALMHEFASIVTNNGGSNTDNKTILAAVNKIGNKIMAEFDDLKATVTEYIAEVDKVIAQKEADVLARIAKAVADDDAGEAVDLKALQADVKTAFDRIKPPEVPPEISNAG